MIIDLKNHKHQLNSISLVQLRKSMNITNLL